MSLARALTVIRSRKSSDPVPAAPSRSLTLKRSFAGSSIRDRISGPMELISTTNMISYNAPDICPSSMTLSSASDLGDSDTSPTDSRSSFTSADSFLEEPTVQPNHLSCYFGSPVSNEGAPSIPRRAPSHTKSTNSVETFLARKNSKHYSSFSSRKTRSMARSSIVMFSSEIDTLDQRLPSPRPETSFELEFDQNRFRYPSAIMESEPIESRPKGYLTFGAKEYQDEVDEIYQLIFGS